jgi:hypothetical protein
MRGIPANRKRERAQPIEEPLDKGGRMTYTGGIEFANIVSISDRYNSNC